MAEDTVSTKQFRAFKAQRRSGAEPFVRNAQPAGFELLGFWQWSASDLLSNATRGILAEFIVARALGLPDEGVRNEWDAFDLTWSVDGRIIKVEVKSAAFLQSWAQKEPTKIKFSVGKKRAWDGETGIFADEAARSADVYVFAVLSHLDKATVDPLDVGQWRFWAVPTHVLNARRRSQHSITFKSLMRLAGEGSSFEELADAVREAVPMNRRAGCNASGPPHAL